MILDEATANIDTETEVETAPKKKRISSRNRRPKAMNMIPRTTFNKNTLPNTFCALLMSCCPSLMEVKVAPPAPIIAPKAAERFITGIVIANPEIANALTPCPMKARSITLYSADAIIAAMAGPE